MRTEVEIKAWVDDPDALRARLAGCYERQGSYLKEDVYYRLGSEGPQHEFRLRVDDGIAVVTAKRKSIVDGVEINAEIEFGVSDPGEFERYAEFLGAIEFARKRKSGERYRAGEATVELSHVDRLGDFIEIERLLDETTPERIREAEQEVRSMLEALSIPADRIEPRYYTDMLAELDR